LRPSPGVAELFWGGCRGTGATLIGALVMGVGAPVVGFCGGSRVAGDHCGVSGAAVSSVGDGGGGGANSGGGRTLTGAGGAPLLGVGSGLVDACGSTEVGCAGPGGGPVRAASTTIGTATAAEAATMSATAAGLV
jgi:hypothetical protein